VTLGAVVLAEIAPRFSRIETLRDALPSLSIAVGNRRIRPPVCSSAQACASGTASTPTAPTPEPPRTQAARSALASAAPTHTAIAAFNAGGGSAITSANSSPASSAEQPKASSNASRSSPCAPVAHAASSNHTPNGEHTDPPPCCSSTAGWTRRAYPSTSSATRTAGSLTPSTIEPDISAIMTPGARPPVCPARGSPFIRGRQYLAHRPPPAIDPTPRARVASEQVDPLFLREESRRSSRERLPLRGQQGGADR
jgi:hypothetical protein